MEIWSTDKSASVDIIAARPQEKKTVTKRSFFFSPERLGRGEEAEKGAVRGRRGVCAVRGVSEGASHRPTYAP